jgi:hypothetical protein
MNPTHWLKKTIVIAAHALMGWGLCGAIIGIGRSVTSMDNTLIVHAVAVPIIFCTLSLLYFKSFHYTTPLQTATIFLGVAMGLDMFVIAPFAERSFAMFASILGTWIPFALIFLATWVTGLVVTNPKRIKQATHPG